MRSLSLSLEPEYTILGYPTQEVTRVLSEDEKTKLLARLRRIEGQTGGLIRMVEDDQYCVKALQQIAAVQGALSQASKLLLQTHLHTCVVNAFESTKAGERDRVINEIVDLFAKSTKAGPSK